MPTLSTTKRPATLRQLIDRFFHISARNSSIKTELIAGLTLFLAMIYSIIVVPNMLASVGFAKESVFIATCLIACIGSLIMGIWANLPIGMGCAISLTAFTAFSLVSGAHVNVATALGAIFIMGCIFSLISITGLRNWILRNLPQEIAQGTGIGIGLFLLLIATTNSDVGLIVKNSHGAIPVAFGQFTSFPVLASFIGLVVIIALEKRKIPGSILLVIITLSILGLLFDKKVHYQGISQLPSLKHLSLFAIMDLKAALNMSMLPVIFALIMTALFDATAVIRAVAEQANLLDEQQQIINGDKALATDSVTSILSGILGTSPATAYIESAAGTAAGGKTGLTAVVVGILFFLTLFLAPLASLVPMYATAPALMYVGLLMLSNVKKLDFSDSIGALSALICAVFIILTGNIVTGIMLGFVALVMGRLFAGQFNKLKAGTLIITLILVAFYALDLAI